MQSEERFHQIFQCRRVFLAVVHVESAEQALRNVAVARDNGAHGGFLINHAIEALALDAIYTQVRAAHPNWWIGLNRLDRTPRRAFQTLPLDASGIWTDGIGLHSVMTSPVLAELMQEAREERFGPDWSGLHFGGVAFKGQPKHPSIAEEARVARLFVDVVTTSGSQTGEPPSYLKIRTLRDAIGGKPLAVASGMTPENVATYLPMVDAFLVATGISLSHTELDPVRVRQLADLIRAF